MRRRWLALLLAIITDAFADVVVVDDVNARVAIPVPASRVVVLAPFAVELLYEAGGAGRIVGAVDYSDYPPAARQLPRVGGGVGLDLERIVALKPDLLIGWASGNPATVVQRLRQLGLPVFLSEPRRLEDIASNIERLGTLLGTTPVARAAAARFRADVAALSKRYADRPPLRVFYQVLDPILFTVNGAHLISQAGNVCGGQNVFRDISKLAPAINEEAVVAADPEVIIGSGTADQWQHWRARWQRYPLRAVRQQALYFIPADELHRSTPRVLKGTARLCEYLDQARQQRRR